MFSSKPVNLEQTFTSLKTVVPLNGCQEGWAMGGVAMGELGIQKGQLEAPLGTAVDL